MIRLAMLSAALVGPAVSMAAAPQITCLGPARASSFVVYLHGLDAPTVGALEQHNREVLARVAERLSVRIALPRAPLRCGQRLCWGATEKAQRRARAVIGRAAARCFPAGASYGLLGFSNGGYLALDLVRACRWRARPRWVAAVASTGVRPGGPAAKGDLSRCPEVTLLVGTRDRSVDPALPALHQLRDHRARVQLSRYRGGHLLTDAALRAVLATGR